MLAIEMLVKAQWILFVAERDGFDEASDVRARAEALRIANDARKQVLLWHRELTAATPPSAAAKPDPGRSLDDHIARLRAPQRDPRAPHRDHGHHHVGCRPGYRLAARATSMTLPNDIFIRIAGEDQAIRRADLGRRSERLPTTARRPSGRSARPGGPRTSSIAGISASVSGTAAVRRSGRGGPHRSLDGAPPQGDRDRR